MKALLPRPRLAEDLLVRVSLAYPPRPGWPYGSWPVSRRGEIDPLGPPRLHPELVDAIEVALALGSTCGVIRGRECTWAWEVSR